MGTLEEASQLFQHVFHADLDSVQQALEDGVDVNMQDGRMLTALHAAAFCCNEAIMDHLLTSGASINAKDDRGVTPLHISCSQKHKEGVMLLRRRDCDVNARTRRWLTAMHACAIYNTPLCADLLLGSLHSPLSMTDKDGWAPLHHAAFRGHTEMTEFLLSRGAAIDAQDRRDRRAIHLAAATNRTSILLLLLDRGADANALDKQMYTALHVAAAEGHIDALRLLLNADCVDRDALTITGCTAMHIAGVNGRAEAVKCLLAAGVSVGALNSSSQTALHLAAGSLLGDGCVRHLLADGRSDPSAVSAPDGRTPLHMAAMNGRCSRVRMLLEAGVSVDCVDSEGCTPLHLAATCGHDAVVDTLLHYGANANSLGPSGMTALHLSSKNGFGSCVQVLLAHHACSLSRDRSARTSLHLAAHGGSLECVKLLMSAGADVNALDSQMRTPLQYAAVRGNHTIVEELIGAGVNVRHRDSVKRSALHYAACGDSDGRTVTALLLNTGIDLQSEDVTCPDLSGYTPLHVAAAAGRAAVLAQLLDRPAVRGVVCPQPPRPEISPLHMAAFRGHLNCLIHLLSLADNVSPRDLSSRTPLHLAAHYGNTACVKSLLQQKADVAAVDCNGWTALHSAAAGGQYSCAALILLHLLNEQRVRHNKSPLELNESSLTVIDPTEMTSSRFITDYVNLTDRKLRTGLMLAVSRESWLLSAGDVTSSAGNCGQLVQLLLKAGARVELVDWQGRTALFRAALGHADDSCDLMLKSSTDAILTQDLLGKTALHVAAAVGSCGVLGSLLQQLPQGRADRLVDLEGCTPLHWASITGQKECVEILLMCGDKLRKLYGNSFSPLHCAAYHGDRRLLAKLVAHFGSTAVRSRSAGRLPLHVAAAHAHTDCVQLLVRASSAPADDAMTVDTVTGRSPLHLAAAAGHTDICEVLLEVCGGGDVVRQRDKDGCTPLHLACVGSHVDAALKLISAVTDDGNIDDLDIADNQLDTALHVCARRGLSAVTERLLLSGASISTINCSGHTPALAVAPSDRHAECLSLILAISDAELSASLTAANRSSGNSARVSGNSSCSSVSLAGRHSLSHHRRISSATNLARSRISLSTQSTVGRVHSDGASGQLNNANCSDPEFF